MHKIAEKEFELDDFAHEHLMSAWESHLTNTIDFLNIARKKFIDTNDKIYWWQMIQTLPSSYKQTRTVQLNYQALRNIYRARKNHKLDEWHEFCYFIETLPFGKELIVDA